MSNATIATRIEDTRLVNELAGYVARDPDSVPEEYGETVNRIRMIQAQVKLMLMADPEVLSPRLDGSVWTHGKFSSIEWRAALRFLYKSPLADGIKWVQDAWAYGDGITVYVVSPEVWELLGGMPGRATLNGREVVRDRADNAFTDPLEMFIPAMPDESAGAQMTFDIFLAARWLAEAAKQTPPSVELPVAAITGYKPGGSLESAEAMARSLRASLVDILKGHLRWLHEDPDLTEVLVPERLVRPGQRDHVEPGAGAGAIVKIADPHADLRARIWSAGANPLGKLLLGWLPNIRSEREQVGMGSPERGSRQLAARVDRAIREEAIPDPSADKETLQSLDAVQGKRAFVEQSIDDALGVMRNSGRDARGLIAWEEDGHLYTFNVWHIRHGVVIMDGYSGKQVAPPVGLVDAKLLLLAHGVHGQKLELWADLIPSVRSELASLKFPKPVTDDDIMQAYVLLKDTPEFGKDFEARVRYEAAFIANGRQPPGLRGGARGRRRGHQDQAGEQQRVRVTAAQRKLWAAPATLEAFSCRHD